MSFRRRLIMSGRPKPYDAEVAYLESNGTQYINTGIVPKSGLDIYCEVQGYSSSPNNTVLFGSRTSGTYSTSNDQLYLNLNGTRMQFYNGTSVLVLDNVYSKTIPDWLFAKLSYTKNTGTRPITLFAFNNINNIDSSLGICRIGKFKVWDDGNVVLDLIPVRKNGVGYMYDNVSGNLLGNSGTGLFSYGTDVYNRDIYTSLSYISNSGSGYISTQYYAKSLKTKVIVDCEFNGNLQTGTWPAPFGSRNNSSNGFDVHYPQEDTVTLGAYIGGESLSSIVLPNWNNRVVISLGERDFVVDGVNYSSAISTTSTTYSFPMTMFNVNQNSAQTNVMRFYGKIYSLKIYEDGIIVHDFVPKVRLFDNLYGMWDNVEEHFFPASKQSYISGQ